MRIVKKADERKKEIIRAARKLFQTRDYGSATMQTLMDELKIAKGTIYHYFASKEELLEAVVEDLIDERLRKKKKLTESSEFQELDALGKFRAFSTFDRLIEDNERILEELHGPGNTILHTRQTGRYITMLAPYYADVIREGCDQGLFNTDCPLECAEFLLAGIQFITDIGFFPWTGDQVARRVKAIPSLVEAQLGAPKGSFSFLSE
ncbi:MAG: TetR/AcrR family transcriptional regulator [Proteobacteria bacterium]|nr:TetR/AcrR family transcriptional regulator [Pseudomonadota bacterium]